MLTFDKFKVKILINLPNKVDCCCAEVLHEREREVRREVDD